jgi:hypothetical protein
MNMKEKNRRRSSGLSFGVAGFVAALLVTSASPALAGPARDSYPADGDHPLRIVHYFVAPVGRLLEWTVTRPLHAIGSQAAPFQHIDARGFSGCSRERPARSCTYVVR